LTFAGRRSGAAAAEDIVQDAYLRLARRANLSDIDNPRAYLYKIVDRILKRDAARSADVSLWTEPDVCIDALLAHDHGAQPQDETSTRLALCTAALDELPDLQRHAFLLHRVDGLTHAEVAQTLGLSKRTVERYVAKALAHCLDRLVGSRAAAGDRGSKSGSD
jgi:RNA polymerase sigma-70 factor (ECF subfamily)